MKTKLLTLIAILIAPISVSFAQTSANYVAPRTEWGQPDLQGVWNFVSSTPLQRPERFGTQEFLTPEEVEADRIRAAERAIAADAAEAELVLNPEAPPVGESTGGYNNFWYETAAIGDNVRTSLIIYPVNGRLPARVEGSAVHTANLGPDVEGDRPVLAVFGGIGKDGPEDRGLSERCLIGFNAGPPFTGGGYNANVQIFQNQDHAVILTEMVHDARIVPLGDLSATELLALGLSAANLGELALANQVVNKLSAMLAASPNSLQAKFVYLEVAALTLHKESMSQSAVDAGKRQQAIELLKEAIALEEQQIPPNGAPTPLKPVHELAGEIMLEMGMAEESAKLFEVSLQLLKNRPWSLLGAARSYAKMNDTAKATAKYRALLAVWSDDNHSAVSEAKKYLN